MDEESLEIDLCSSSLLDGETGNKTRFNKDIDRSSGEPELKGNKFICLIKWIYGR